jgi:hypothetical protein
MSPREGVERAASASASVGTIVLAALIPKCPLCVAAALSALGVGATVGSAVAPFLRPVGLALAVFALVVFGRSEWRRRARLRRRQG